MHIHKHTCSGMMLLEPSQERFDDMLKKMHTLASYDDGDQGFLNAYFGQVCIYMCVCVCHGVLIRSQFEKNVHTSVI